MFPNLKAEMARKGHTHEDAARCLGMSRSNFESKLRKGKFKLAEIRQLCELYGCDFDYLFASFGRGGG